MILKDKFSDGSHYSDDVDLGSLEGKKFKDIHIDEDKKFIMFELDSGEVYQMYHSQDCCEPISLNDVCGEISDLIDAEIIHFEEENSCNNSGSESWTLYDIQTAKGSVKLKWYGESNGYVLRVCQFCRSQI